MRILYVLTDADVGGAERFVLTLLRHRRPEDRTGLIVLLDRGTLSDELDAAADWVRYLGFAPSSRRLDRMVSGLRAAVEEFAPDVISSHLFHSDLVVALVRTPVPRTTTVHTQGFGPSDHPLTKAIARGVGALSRRFRAVIPASDSPQMAAFLRRMRYRNVVTPIRNGAELPPQPRWDPASRVLVSLSRNHPVKGHAELFAAAAPLLRSRPEWRLDCYGAGVVAEEPGMRARLEAAGALDLVDSGRIRLLGPTSRPQDALASASALVISSTYGEAFPIVGAEAAGLGVPVISTELGSTPEFVDDPDFLVPPGDVPALAAALEAWVDADAGRRELASRSARTRAERDYAPERIIDAYAAVFESILAR